jgi:hypothetical protein
MVWYVACVAVVNIGVGYALATYLSACRRPKPTTSSFIERTSDEPLDDDEYYADDQYDADFDDAELTSTAR